MIKDIKGLHHVTSMAGGAQQNSTFFTRTMGLRRVKKTVNFDAPDVYHLYYGDATGTPGTIMTCFPFGNIARRRRGIGEIGLTEFAIPKGAMLYWTKRLADHGTLGMVQETSFGNARLTFEGPDREEFALVETERYGRSPWTENGVPDDVGILGFHSARMRVKDMAATAELLRFMGYEQGETEGNVTRFQVDGGNAANAIDVEQDASGSSAAQGAGSVHHIAFAVEDKAAQLTVRDALLDTGYQVTPVTDRNYFWSIYFRTPGGILFEIATHEPGFELDEDTAHLGQTLKLPSRYEPQRANIEAQLATITD